MNSNKNLMHDLMKMSLLFATFVLLSCNNKPSLNNKTGIDSTLSSNTVEPSQDSVKTPHTDAKLVTDTNRSIESYIKKYPENQKEELISTIKYEINEWKLVESPFVATYKGNEFGDYWHLNFSDSKGKGYDFGSGNNDYGNYPLFKNNDQYEDNPKYVGKTFNIYWEWKLSEFPCCDGEYGKAKAYMPSIVKLELME